MAKHRLFGVANANLNSTETRIARSMSEGSFGSRTKTEYRSCISSSTCDSSRFQNLSRIYQLEEDMEVVAFR